MHEGHCRDDLLRRIGRIVGIVPAFVGRGIEAMADPVEQRHEHEHRQDYGVEADQPCPEIDLRRVLAAARHIGDHKSGKNEEDDDGMVRERRCPYLLKPFARDVRIREMCDEDDHGRREADDIQGQRKATPHDRAPCEGRHAGKLYLHPCRRRQGTTL